MKHKLMRELHSAIHIDQSNDWKPLKTRPQSREKVARTLLWLISLHVMKRKQVDPIRSIRNLSGLESLWSVDNEVLTALLLRFPASAYSDHFNYVTVNRAWVIFKLLVVQEVCLFCDQTTWLIGITFCVSWDNTSVLINAITSDVIHLSAPNVHKTWLSSFSNLAFMCFLFFFWCLLKITLVKFNYSHQRLADCVGFTLCNPPKTTKVGRGYLKHKN